MAQRNAISWAAAVAALAIALAAPVVLVPLAGTARGLALDAAFTSLLLSLVAVTFASRASEPLADRLGLGPGRLPVTRTAVAVAGLVGLSQALEGAIHLAGLGGTGALAEIDAIVQGARGLDLALLLAGAALCAGVGEELFARGWILRGVARRFGDAAGVAVSAVIFGVLHADPVHAVAALGLGLYLGWLTLATGAIRASIVAHVLNNAVALAGTAFGIDVAATACGPVVALAGAALAGAGLVATRRAPARVAPAAVARAPEP